MAGGTCPSCMYEDLKSMLHLLCLMIVQLMLVRMTDDVVSLVALGTVSSSWIHCIQQSQKAL